MNLLVNWRKSFHLDRSRQIARVLLSHGWNFLRNSDEHIVGPTPAITVHTRPVHLRLALEELGTTFIKLGQILSTRADLLPPEYLVELAKLQDSAPSIAFEEIQQALVTELGQSLNDVFSDFDPMPLAAASIGQAHVATLRDGTEVVVKIRRPGVVEQVNEDLEILKELAATAGRHWDFADRYDLSGLVEEFSQTLRSELDYIREGHNAERFAANFAADSRVHIPRVVWEATTSRVLTLERIRGLKINDLEGLDKQGTDRHWLAQYATNIVLKMVCEDGIFHADPHPGNFYIEPNGAIGLIDFGMVGVLDERTQELLADLLIAISHQDADRLVDVFLDLGVTQQRVDRASVGRDIERLLSTYWGLPLGDLKVTALLNDVYSVMRRHHLHLPANLALLLKTVIMIEGLGVNLDPDFRFAKSLTPYTERLVMRQYSPLRWLRGLGRASLDLAKLGAEMPQHVRRIVSAAENGNLQIGMRPEGFDPVVNRLERIANRIVLGVIAAAFINGLAVLVSVYRPPGWERWAWIVFAFGFLCALLLGVYLAWTILRPKHSRRV
ncbi:MAG TPA: AarF/ABC1/UbiB kinase family protein [Pyrinomonadaceae bacterium]|nr:AarF/ABC1/UbiB kinase family protein [Pyrinomonadaceae bacterium]